MFLRSYAVVAVLAMTLLHSQGDVTRVQASYVDGFLYANPLVDINGAPLTAGTAADGDGAVVQIGYFQGVSDALDPANYGLSEWAQFTPLTGQGSPNAARHLTSIGDRGSGAIGDFGFFLIPDFDPIMFDPALDLGLPGAYPTRLGIRFYDGTTIANSSGYNTVTSPNSLWLLNQPTSSSPPMSVLNMDSHALIWETGAAGAGRTSIIVTPEPASAVLTLLGSLALLARRRR